MVNVEQIKDLISKNLDITKVNFLEKSDNNTNWIEITSTDINIVMRLIKLLQKEFKDKFFQSGLTLIINI